MIERNDMKWISVNDRLPDCKNGLYEFEPDHFIYRKRVPHVMYWKSK